MNSDHSRLVGTAIAAAGPLAVILVRLLGAGAGPAAAEPHQGRPEMAEPDLSERVRATPDQLSAWAEAREVLLRPPPPRAEPDPVSPVAVIETPQGGRPIVAPRYLLSAVMGAGERGAAVMNERIYWVGADLGNGWTLYSVDSVARTVTLRHGTGAEHRISLDTNG